MGLESACRYVIPLNFSLPVSAANCHIMPIAKRYSKTDEKWMAHLLRVRDRVRATVKI